MPGPFAALSKMYARWRAEWVARRRQRNLRTGTRVRAVPVQRAAVHRYTHNAVPARSRSVYWGAVAGVLLLAAGGALIAGHARHLAAAVSSRGAGEGTALDALQPLVPGAAFDVSADPVFKVVRTRAGALIVAPGAVPPAPVHIDLCQQSLDAAHTRIATLRVGYRFDALARLADGEGRGKPGLVRNALVLGDDAPATPALDITGRADRREPLAVRWHGIATPGAQWVSDIASSDTASSGTPRSDTARSGDTATGVRVPAPASGPAEEDTRAGSRTETRSGTFDREGWLVWSAGAVRLQRRVTAACPQGGELLVSVLRVGQSQSTAALVTAVAPGLAATSVTLNPGHYQVPAVPRPGLEDQTLFVQLQARGLLRLGADGLIELAPRDLPAWRAAQSTERAAALGAWSDVRLDDGTLALLKRLYRMADGEYVRQQVDTFNAERRLLAVRVKDMASAPTPRGHAAGAAAATSDVVPLAARSVRAWQGNAAAAATATSDVVLRAASSAPARQGDTAGAMSATSGVMPSAASSAPAWQADAAGAAAATSDVMPPAASALFAQLPQGWSAWTRIAQWPATTGAPRARLVLPLPGGASPETAQPLEVMLAGRLVNLTGASITRQRDACTGRACPDRGAVRIYTLAPQSGAGAIALEAAPLSMDTLSNPGDAKYRHLRVADGRLVWQSLDDAAAPARAPAREITIADRNGTPLWTAGAPTDDARSAGLAPLLGIHAGQANGVAGMLARVDGTAPAHAARLTIDLPLQQLAQRTLDCIAMQRGQWSGHACAHAKTNEPAQGRRAGVVILDADTGDILAAAGSGMGDPYASPWPELRDFDRANPAASPLRLPTWQHDGGVHNSPGSTFKVISALGLELAAKRDPQVEQLLAGLPLADINRVAQQRGFAFRTDAAAYPLGTTRAHVTNYRDGLLDRRAQEGRFGLAQALTYSLNTWFAWNGELSDRTLLGHSTGGLADVEALEPGALDTARPILAMARLVGFERPLRLDGGLLPADYPWRRWDALQASPARIDPVNARHELRQLAIGLRMQTTPLHMAMAAGAVGQGRVLAPRLLLQLDGQAAQAPVAPALDVRLDRIRAGMKGVIDRGTAAGAFRAPELASIRGRLYGKTGTAPTVAIEADGTRRDVATVWFTGWLEPGALPGQRHRLAFAAYASHSDGTGGEHAAPVIAAILATLAQTPAQNRE